MNDNRRFIALVALLAAVGTLLPFAADAADTHAGGQAGGAVVVTYLQPDQFTDLGGNGYAVSDGRRDALLEQLTRHIERGAAARIPAGCTLTVTVTDVDMAGAFEPLRGGRYERVRILREVYPPRIKLQFRLTNAEGNAMKEGSRDLTNLAYLGNVEHRNDVLRHEKKLLDDWLEREFSALERLDQSQRKSP